MASRSALDPPGVPISGGIPHGVHAQVQAVRLHAIQLPGRPGRSQEEHRRLVTAIRRGDATDAEDKMRRHIIAVKEDVLARLSGAPPEGRSA
jgi:DNA-binding FadR family transcriptional regulator